MCVPQGAQGQAPGPGAARSWRPSPRRSFELKGSRKCQDGPRCSTALHCASCRPSSSDGVRAFEVLPCGLRHRHVVELDPGVQWRRVGSGSCKQGRRGGCGRDRLAALAPLQVGRACCAHHNHDGAYDTQEMRRLAKEKDLQKECTRHIDHTHHGAEPCGGAQQASLEKQLIWHCEYAHAHAVQPR
eukprot:scaffold27036_cov63-Phaeocystis_antarctica.AAC.5